MADPIHNFTLALPVAEPTAKSWRTTKADLIVGLDCGVHTGAVIYSRKEKRLTYCKSLDFWAAYELVSSMSCADVEVVIEIHGRGALYARSDSLVARGGKGRDKLASNVGANRREAVLLADGLERLGYNVRRVRPVNAKKWDAETFMRFTGWPKGENEHVRDACRLIWGL